MKPLLAAFGYVLASGSEATDGHRPFMYLRWTWLVPVDLPLGFDSHMHIRVNQTAVLVSPPCRVMRGRSLIRIAFLVKSASVDLLDHT
jgi:hypothetical protein